MSIDRVSRARVVVGRVLICLSAILAIVMPWTENSWHFDKFPYGGEDFELSVFVIVAILGLVLVLLQHCQKGVILILVMEKWLLSIFEDTDSAAQESFCWLIVALHSPPLPNDSLDKLNLPLLV